MDKIRKMLKIQKVESGGWSGVKGLYMPLDKLPMPHFRKQERVLTKAGEEQAVIMDGASAKLQVLLHSSQES